MPKNSKKKKLKRMGFFSLSAVSVLATSLWLKRAGDIQNYSKPKYVPVSNRLKNNEIAGQLQEV